MATTDARLDDILDRLRHQGGRVTTTRRAIVSALLTSPDHVTAEELASVVRAHHPDVHLSTVYRCLEALEGLGVVDHVHLGHGRAVYHLTHERHQHLVCEECGSVTEAPDRLFDDLAGEVLADYGFTLRPNHFALVGRCAACRG